MDPLIIWLTPGVGMVLVGVLAIVFWRRASGAAYRWFWVGAAVWTVAVALKLVFALLANAAVIGALKGAVPYPWMVLLGGLYIGVESAVFEIGLTLLAVLLWRRMGKDATRAIAIGLGAGAIEAVLLGLAVLTAVAIGISGVEGADAVREQFAAALEVSPLAWLIGPVERLIAVACHASSRALVLLGVVHRRAGMVWAGFAVFTLIDSLAGGVHVSGRMGEFSLWWVELALLPAGIASVPILIWCYRGWGEDRGPHPLDRPLDNDPAAR